MSKTPKVTQPDPTPVFEEAKPADEEMTARRDERKRLRQAFNARNTILDGGNAGRKTLLGV
nr:hypothetical protein [Synergistaceae bacterium]